MNEQTSHEERAAKALQDINDLAQALQKKNPDLGWEEAQNQAYKQLTNGVKP
jgi:imidazoleglycerol phosphate synthase glutamine amidotransferase subunit HisH